jgi:hypothetical protein
MDGRVLKESRCAGCGMVLARLEENENGLSAWSFGWCPTCNPIKVVIEDDESKRDIGGPNDIGLPCRGPEPDEEDGVV